MTEHIENPKSPEKKLREFRDKIQKIKDEEMRRKTEWETRGRKGGIYQPEFDTIDSEDLGELELAVWEKYEKGGLTMEDFLKLREEAIKSYDAFYREAVDDPEKLKKHPSCSSFWAWLVNKIEE